MFRSLKIILFALSAVFSVCFFANFNSVEAVSDDIKVNVTFKGSCSTNHYDCGVGTSSDNVENIDYYTWMCNGSDDSATTDDVSCRQEKYQLSVISSGGTVTSTPSGISCGSTCSYKFDSGTKVTLTADPNTNYSFSGWSGACTGQTCEVTMDSAKSVTANYTQLQYTLRVTSSNGTVTSTPSGISCGSTCSYEYNSGTVVVLTANPNDNYSFSSWNGCNSVVDGNCNVTMNGDKTVNALFSPVGVLSGSITSPHCTVAVGESSCDTTITWSVVNYAQGSTTEVTTPENKVIGNTHSGSTTYEITLSEGNRNFFLYNSGKTDDYLDTDYSYAECESGMAAVNGFCPAVTQTYKVTFDANGGTGTMSQQTFTQDVSQNLNANQFIRTGYVFKNWNTSYTGSGTTYTDKQSITISSNTTLYAMWEKVADTYTVTFNANGGTGTMSQQTFTQDVSQNLNANQFIRTGYVFKNWNTSSTGSGTSYVDKQSIAISSSMTLYAIWEVGSSCTVSATVVPSRRGTVSPTSVTIPCGQKTSFQITPSSGYCLTSADSITGCGSGGILSPSVPTRGTYTYTTPVVNQSCALSIGISTECKTLISTSVNNCTIDPTYDIENLSWLSSTKVSFAVTPFANYYVSSVSGCSGSIIGGDVNTGVTYQTGKITSSTNDCTVSAVCAIKTYKVTFNANGGTGTMSQQTFISGVKQNLNTNRFTNVDYTFIGWTDGSGNFYTNEQSVTMTKDTTLYASWQPVARYLNVEVSGSGSVSSVPAGISCLSDCFEGYSYGTEVVLTATPVSGHSFSGWSGDCSGIGTCTLVMNENKNVTATFVDSTVTPSTLTHNTTPNTSVSFAYTTSDSLSPSDSECRLLDYQLEPLTEYQTNNPILQTSPSSSGNYSYRIECRNKNNYSIKAISPEIIVNVVVVSVALPTNIGYGSPSDLYNFTFIPSSLPTTPADLNQASCQLLNNDKSQILVGWTPATLNVSNSLSYNLPTSLGSFGYYIRCRNNIVTTATADSEMIVITTSCPTGQVLDPTTGSCAEPTFSASDCLISSGENSCYSTIGWNIHDVSGTWAVTTNVPDDNQTVVNIYSTPGSTDYSIGYGTTPFFLYNNGNEMGSTTAEASCRAGTVWDEDELQCLIPPSTINVVVCTIPEGGSSCVTSQDVTWHVENDQGKDFTFYYPENKTDIGGTEGNVGPVTINYGENVFAIKDGEEIIVENRVVGTCTENTNWENGICVLSSPEVKSFKAEPNVIFDGGTSTLSWNFDEELIDSCDISFQLSIDDTVSYLMSTSESTGETDVSPTGTTIYYLDCYRQEGEDTIYADRQEAIVSVIDMVIEEK